MVRPIVLRALGALVLAFSTAILASPSAAAACSAAERTVADRALMLSPAQQRASIARHLPWGVPPDTAPVTNERLLIQSDYVIRYDADLRVPLWTAERIDFARLGAVARADCFRADPRLPAAQASTPADYREPIYDQGHIAPFADQSTSAVAGHNSFIMSNMAPQTCQFNRGIWQILEGITRLWAQQYGTVFVVSGSVFDRDGDNARDADSAAQRMRSTNGNARVAVPSHFYKVIAIQRPGGRVATLAVMMPHGNANPDGPAALRYLRDHVTTIGAIERVAGIDLFPGATNLDESATLWTFAGRQPRSLCNVGRTQ
jgi:endonuclease G